MAYTDVSICNLALTHLGDKAAVVSISAPTTAQENYCATYYPIARDLTLESHSWSFNTVRAALVTSAVTPPTSWAYCYDAPTGIMRLIELLDPNADDDYATATNFTTQGNYGPPIPNVGVPIPYPFAQEYDVASTKNVIYTNLQNAIGRYTVAVTDPSKFPNDVVMAVGYQLASFLAGPIIKGDVGVKVSQDMAQMAERWLTKAKGSDANERNIKPAPGAPWILNR